MTSIADIQFEQFQKFQQQQFEQFKQFQQFQRSQDYSQQVPPSMITPKEQNSPVPSQFVPGGQTQRYAPKHEDHVNVQDLFSSLFPHMKQMFQPSASKPQQVPRKRSRSTTEPVPIIPSLTEPQVEQTQSSKTGTTPSITRIPSTSSTQTKQNPSVSRPIAEQAPLKETKSDQPAPQSKPSISRIPPSKQPEPTPSQSKPEQPVDPSVSSLAKLDEFNRTVAAIESDFSSNCTRQVLEGKLMQILLQLDDLPISDILKPVRKALITKINQLLDRLDSRPPVQTPVQSEESTETHSNIQEPSSIIEENVNENLSVDSSNEQISQESSVFEQPAVESNTQEANENLSVDTQEQTNEINSDSNSDVSLDIQESEEDHSTQQTDTQEIIDNSCLDTQTTSNVDTTQANETNSVCSTQTPAIDDAQLDDSVDDTKTCTLQVDPFNATQHINNTITTAGYDINQTINQHDGKELSGSESLVSVC